MKILIIYAKNETEIYNRKSALGSYINILSKLISHNGNTVYVNGVDIQEDYSFVEQEPTSNKSIKKAIPSILKEYLKDKNLKKNHNALKNKIEAKFDYEIIIEFYSYYSNLGLSLKNKYKIPLITILDAPVLDEYLYFHSKCTFGKRKMVSIQNETLIHSNSIVVYNLPMKNYVSTIIKRDDNIYIHQNIDFTRFEFSEPIKTQKINIGFIGSFLKWHRVDLLVESFNNIASKISNTELYLIGEGLELENIRKQVQSSPHKNRIHITGFLDGENLIEIKKIINIGVMPGSNWYGAPNKIFEYGASGIAVLAPNTDAIVDIFSEDLIQIFKSNSLEDLTQKLFLICNDEKIRNNLSHKLKSFIQKNYSADKTLTFYQKLLLSN